VASKPTKVVVPPAEELMSMTPAQKQEFLTRRKLQQKREADEHSQRRDPEVLILEKKQTACKAYLDAKSLLEAANAPKDK
jgi:hypothetical protein